MTMMTEPVPATSHPGWFSRAESWLDSKGKGAWIAAMVLGFVFFWPVGLAFLFYMIWSKRMFSKSCSRRTSWKQNRMTVSSSTGNSAFDAYKTETLRRLEEEQNNFESFLERLREAKDKAEFDQFMDERAKQANRDRDDGEAA
ncbi:DUF2852 domain-containing protein [Sedimentitalea todarodis]|uniref:DUF2852 domain-containing protein n=1 Tax=Sedimentitalea todarodis TaxID=1631240 RepID=A0ABU3VB50_9RHOB|nr:DUF2852 domain-containing protein [Sedimentitalea todarodis]MDU9003405.1 DUF2852 domain-containing protein [Sedimentitalea todarodis]